MDSKSNTALRAALTDAAADSFNDVQTPGQKLLEGLQASEVRTLQNAAHLLLPQLVATCPQLPQCLPA
jgi:hypothetical protein